MYSLDWPRAFGTPKSTACFKLIPEDFQVNEYFEGQFTGEGEHIVLKIEKKGINTEDVVKSLARMVNKSVKLISYAGLKDRHAVTTQYFSIHAPGQVIEGVGQLEGAGWKVLEVTRHNKKIKPGFLSGNHFVIKLRDLSDEDDFARRVEQIKITGVPNYFGEQRFGRECGNLAKAEQLLVHGKKGKDRFLHGLYCSAARSWIYNLILAKRVIDSTWNIPIDGDVIQLNGSKSIFVIDKVEEEIISRIKKQDLSPASPLPGKSKNRVTGAALKTIGEVYADWQPWVAGLEKQGSEEAWRANILPVDQIEYTIYNRITELSFTLPAGSYATVVLRELTNYLT